MARLLLQRKAGVKSTMKPLPVAKEPKHIPAVEFRWSTTKSQFGLSANVSLLNFQFLDLDESPQKAVVSSPNSTTIASLSLREKSSSHSPRLPPITNAPKKTQSSTATDENDNPQVSPLVLNYCELHRAQIPLKTKKKSPAQFSIYPLSPRKRSHNTSVPSDSTLSAINDQQLTNNQYIRLPISQLRRLHVSNKYLKEAKTLYFNPVSKVFVPRQSIIQVSS